MSQYKMQNKRVVLQYLPRIAFLNGSCVILMMMDAVGRLELKTIEEQTQGWADP